jgi:hypothetical protein
MRGRTPERQIFVHVHGQVPVLQLLVGHVVGIPETSSQPHRRQVRLRVGVLLRLRSQEPKIQLATKCPASVEAGRTVTRHCVAQCHAKAADRPVPMQCLVYLGGPPSQHWATTCEAAPGFSVEG